MAPELVHGSRRKAVFLLVAAVALVGASLLAMMHPTKPADGVMGLVGIVLFGLGAAVAVVMIVRPGRLEMGDDGVLFAPALGRRTFVRFDDVAQFVVMDIRGARHVGFRYRPGYPASRMSRLSRGLADVDGSFGGSWSVSAPDLVARLNARLRAG